MPTRQQIAFYLDDIETPLGKAFNVMIMGLILLSSSIFVLETYSISEELRQVLEVIDRGTFVVFTSEYLLRLWCTDRRLKFIFRPLSLIDLVVLLSYFIGGIGDMRFIRVFRSLRILRLIRFVEVNNSLLRISSEDGKIFAKIIFSLLTIVFVFSGLIYQVEHPINPQDFNTFLDSVYFSIATMTTVGFGDVTPVSQFGRLLTVLMILTGIILIPWQVGELVKQLAKSSNQKQSPCPKCGLNIHDVDAHFCRSCGESLTPELVSGK
jgi:voltage-gated potassium channel